MKAVSYYIPDYFQWQTPITDLDFMNSGNDSMKPYDELPSPKCIDNSSNNDNENNSKTNEKVNLVNLPPELLYKIITNYLDYPDIIKLSKTNKKLRLFCLSKYIIVKKKKIIKKNIEWFLVNNKPTSFELFKLNILKTPYYVSPNEKKMMFLIFEFSKKVRMDIVGEMLKGKRRIIKKFSDYDNDNDYSTKLESELVKSDFKLERRNRILEVSGR